MLAVMLSLISGILFGFSLRNREKAISAADRMATWFVYLLLFFLGASVGVNETVINNLGRLGVQAIVLSSGGIIGSVLISYFVYICFFREDRQQ